MVVLAVMGLLAGVAVWRWPRAMARCGRMRWRFPSASPRRATRRSCPAVPLALEVDAAGYRFVQRGDEGWQPVTEPACANAVEPRRQPGRHAAMRGSASTASACPTARSTSPCRQQCPARWSRSPPTARSASVNRNGFTLLEMLVALAVFSIAALALLRLDAVSVATASELKAREGRHAGRRE
jgi:prepilin-type N-terminal cleavage/methylation domain-containing protein